MASKDSPSSAERQKDMPSPGEEESPAAAAPSLPAAADRVSSPPVTGVTASGLHFDDDDNNLEASPSQSSRASTHDDEKSHTFRQRRLTYTRHHPGGAAMAAAAAALAAELSDSDDDDAQKKNTAAAGVTIDLSKSGAPGESAAVTAKDDDAKTDGKDETVEGAEEHGGGVSPTTGSPPPKKRRLEPRVLHATAPPRHMRKEVEHRLYEHQNSECAAHKLAETEHAVHVEDQAPSKKEVPAWRKRRFIRHSIKEDESLLPFPRHVVGTYSCHGVEPLYDSDYEHEEDDDEDKNDSEDSDDDIKGAAKTVGDNTLAKINQDRGGVAFPYGNCPRTALFAAYDGHGDGGEYVAQYALHEVQRRLEIHPQFDTDIAKAFHDTFVAVDEDLMSVPDIEPLYAGATACVVLLREGTLTVANAGDSRAVLARRPLGSGKSLRQTMDLSVDQNPDSPGEQERIEAAGGYVSPPPEPGLSARVWLDPEYTQIGLAMARSLGDHAVKSVGVIPDPVVTSHDLKDEDEFMIIATDGVWEFISSEDAVEIVARHLDAGEGASRACQCLIEEAAAKWHDFEGDYRDDITALVVTFDKIWDHSPRRPSS